MPVFGIEIDDEIYEGKTVLDGISEFFGVTGDYFTEFMFPFIVIPEGSLDQALDPARYQPGYQPIA